jgi:type I restriction enzyme S subunit
MVAIRPGEAMHADYLVHLLNGPGREHALASQAGSAHPHLNLRDIRATPVLLTPLAEQERIVAAIEEAFSKLDAGEAGLRTVRQLFKRMRDATLAAAVSGRLGPQDPTDTPAAEPPGDCRPAPAEGSHEQLPPGWASCAFDRCFVVIGDGGRRVAQRDYLETGALAVVDQGEGLIGGYTDETSAQVATELPVLVFGDHTRRVKLVDFPFAVGASGTKVLRPAPDLLDARFAELALVTRQLEDRGYGRHFALLRSQPLPVPPLPEQGRIVAEVERQMSFIEACERAVDAGLERSAALRRSVLKAAFEGRLVPQDPTDEPASVLLERIRAERAAAPKTKTRRAKAKS